MLDQRHACAYGQQLQGVVPPSKAKRPVPVYLVSIQCYDHEVLWLSVAAKNHGHVVAGAVYRLGSGHGGDPQLLDYLDTTIDEAERYGSHTAMTGDFNVHNQSWLGSFKTTRAGELMDEI